jgi:hypothetical protein
MIEVAQAESAKATRIANPVFFMGSSLLFGGEDIMYGGLVKVWQGLLILGAALYVFRPGYKRLGLAALLLFWPFIW